MWLTVRINLRKSFGHRQLGIYPGSILHGSWIYSSYHKIISKFILACFFWRTAPITIVKKLLDFLPNLEHTHFKFNWPRNIFFFGLGLKALLLTQEREREYSYCLQSSRQVERTNGIHNYNQPSFQTSLSLLVQKYSHSSSCSHGSLNWIHMSFSSMNWWIEEPNF